MDEFMNVYIPGDAMSAVCTFAAPSEGGKEMTEEDIKKVLAENGVVYGIKEDTIQRFLAEKNYEEEYIFAVGTDMVQGKNGEITYHISASQEITPKMNQDGTVDYKELNLLNSVEPGYVLASMTMPQSGTDGKNVRGEVIPAVNGKPAVFSFGKNIKISEDGTKLLSEITGNASIVGSKVFVSEVLEVAADVDLSTGNIDFVGSVHVHGNVKGGFCIKAKGEVIVDGVVEDAIIHCGGNVIVKQGIHGMERGEIITKGNICAKFIESATVSAGGVIESESILHSQVDAKEFINLIGKKGLLIGGRVQTTGSISAMTIGNEMGTATLIEIGFDPKMKKEYDEIRVRKKDIKESLESAAMIVSNYKMKTKKGVQLTEDQTKEFKQTLQKLQFQQKLLTDMEKKEEDIKELLKKQTSAGVSVTGTVYPGTTIAIKDVSLTLKAKEDHTKFVSDGGEIIKKPL
ncbi:MAG: FapA family protein [Eubacterium sp.]|nr:FapA family protein [Eubacterium sp.]